MLETHQPTCSMAREEPTAGHAAVWCSREALVSGLTWLVEGLTEAVMVYGIVPWKNTLAKLTVMPISAEGGCCGGGRESGF